MKLIKALPYLLFASPLMLNAQIRLPKIISNGMILQRDEAVNVWGWASPGEKVTVKFNKKTYHATTGKDSVWAVKLSPTKKGGPYSMELSGKNKIVLNDILMGDVWFCSGQSNMVHQLRLHSIIFAKDIAEANYPHIRQFFIPNTTNLITPQEDITGSSWKPATKENITEFSAVAYFFAKKLHDKYKVPVGIINSSWGGTPVEAWISEGGFKEFSTILQTVAKNKDTAYINKINAPVAKATEAADIGMEGKWFDPAYVPKAWRNIAIPGYWEDQGVRNLDGVVWFRREIEIPEKMAKSAAKIFIGRIVDADEVYINGIKVGSSTYMYPQRRYSIPDGVLKPGKNLIVVRVTNNTGKGGFVPDKPYYLATDTDTVALSGYWQYKVGRVSNPNAKHASTAINLHYQPTALYNTMVAPLINYNIKGFAWYQGESNSGRPQEYTALQTALINDWRNKWHNQNLPFLFVQLPGYMDYNYWPSESNWALFREAQAKTLAVPKTAMAVAIDLGEWNDVHPDRKKEVGERLALAAQTMVYGDKEVASSGPVYKSFSIEGNKITVLFESSKGLATSDGEAPGEFAIAGADKQFVWAEALIEGNRIILWNDDVPEPKFVRYAWADNPVNPNLVNTEGLPASPFRTDN
jgi:sialate O-acetylesterase